MRRTLLLLAALALLSIPSATYADTFTFLFQPFPYTVGNGYLATNSTDKFKHSGSPVESLTSPPEIFWC